MKRILKITLVAFIMVLGGAMSNSVAAQYGYDNQYGQDNEVSYQTFYDELSPYGQWVDYPNYGYVWVPDAGPDFRPYSTNGHWVWTDDYEWMWVSDYDWGWAPFHYGRWEEDPYYGWIWVPGYEWSPAWVAWRDGGDYYGWAPLRPGISISINFNIGSYSPPYDYWCFVPRRYITSPRIYDYYVDRSINISIINYTTIINYNSYRSGYGFRSGPRRYDAERYCGRINPVRFRQSYTPGRTFYRNNEVSVYRPSIRTSDNRTAAPRKFERYDRNNGGFRNRTADNNVRRDDNGGFRRNSDINRNDNTVRQPQMDGNTDRRRFDRNTNTGGQPDNRNMDRRPNPRSYDNNNGQVQPRQDQRQFERRNEQVQPRQDQRQFERRNEQVQPRQDQPRQFERRNEQVQPRQDQPRQFERRNEQVQPRQDQPRQIERRSEPQIDRQPAPQVEQKRQEQGRGFERKDDGNKGNGNGNGGEQRGKGRGRF